MRSASWPAQLVSWNRDGIGSSIGVLGGQVQSQTIGLGDGSTTVFCSGVAKFCGASSSPVGAVSVSGPMFLNGAAFTGASLVGASISGTTLTVPATTGLPRGALEPGMLLTDTTGSITGSPSLVNCLTGCTFANFNSNVQQTWTIISVSSGRTVSAGRR